MRNNLWNNLWNTNNKPDYHQSVNQARKENKDAIYKTTDIWLNRFRLTHKNIFDKIWWLEIKKHYILAQEIVKSSEVWIEEIKSLISDWNVDSNIRMELVLALFENWKYINKDIFKSLKSNLISINENSDWVIEAKSQSYIYSIFLFRNWVIKKWYVEKIEKDIEKEWDFIYHIWWYLKIKSSWEKA